MKRLLVPAAVALLALEPAEAQQLSGAPAASESSASPRAGVPVRNQAARALDRRITLRLDEAPLAVALEQIARAAEMGFAYSRDLLPRTSRVSLVANEMPASDALDRVLSGTGLTYAVTGAGQLTVLREREARADGRITGRVVQATTREPLDNVYVQIEGTNRGARTNDAGEFLIRDVAPGTYELSARRIGLAKGTQRVIVEDGGTARVEFALSPTANTLDQVVVTSSVAETQLRAVPVDVTVVTAEMIREKNITNVQQLFRGDIPGIFMEDQGYLNTDPFSDRTPQVRGQNFLSGDAGATSKLKVYVDGVELADYGVIAQMDPNTIDRMEVVRGPAATTMYGSGASDGVVQIFTKRGTSGSPRISAGLSAQAFDSPYMANTVLSPRAEVSLSGGSDAFSYNASASFERQGEWVPDYESDRKNFSLGLRWENGPFTLSATALADGPNNYNGIQSPFIALGLYEGRFSRVKIPEWSLMPENRVNTAKSLTSGLTVQYRVTPTWNHSLTVGTNNYSTRAERLSPRFQTIEDSLLMFITSASQTTTLSYNNTWLASLGGWLRSTLTTGFELSSGNYDYTSVGNVNATTGSWFDVDAVTRNESRNAGYFAQSELAFTERIYLTTGVRAEENPNYGRDVGLNVAPRFGLAYVHDIGQATIKLRGAYGWASRPPLSFQKQGGPTSVSTSGNNIQFEHNLANPDLEAAESRGGDYGADLNVGNWLSFSVTHFRQFADKDIYTNTVTDTVPLEPPALEIHLYDQFINIGKVETRGWEFRGRVAYNEWYASGTYSPVDNYVRSLPNQEILTAIANYLEVGARLEHIPRYTASTTIGYSGLRTQANLSSTAQGNSRGNDAVTSWNLSYGVPQVFGVPTPARDVEFPKWVKYDFNISHQFLPKLQGFLRVQNIFDKRVVEGYVNDMPEGGRIFTIGTRWTNY